MGYIDIYKWKPTPDTIPVVCKHLAAMLAKGGLIRTTVAETTIALYGAIAARNLAAAYRPDVS
jgi:hypothetical protein